MNYLALGAANPGPVLTTDATVVSVAEYTLVNNTQGELMLELSGTNQNNPSIVYSWSNLYTVSCDAGVATIRASGPSPTIIDPSLCGAVVTVDASGALIRLRIAAPLVPWSWMGKARGLLHAR